MTLAKVQVKWSVILMNHLGPLLSQCCEWKDMLFTMHILRFWVDYLFGMHFWLNVTYPYFPSATFAVLTADQFVGHDDDFPSDCRNVSHQQQFFSELPTPGRSNYTNYWYSWVQTIYYVQRMWENESAMSNMQSGFRDCSVCNVL